MRTYRHRHDLDRDLAAECGGAYDLGDGSASPLDTIASHAGGYDRALDGILEGVLDARAWGGTLAATGMSLPEWLQHVAGLPTWLASQLAGVAERLPALPSITACWRDGVLPYDGLAGFVSATRELNGELLAKLEAESADRARRHVRDRLGLREWLWGIEEQVDDLRAPHHRTRVAERREQQWASTTRVQGDLDGGGRITSDLNPLDFATVVPALERDAGQPAPDVPRTQQRAQALVRWALAAQGGTTPGGRRRAARPSVTVVVDLATATSDRFGRLLATATGHRTPWLTATLTETLAANGDLLVQLADGHNPLAEIAATTQDIPAKTRRAIEAAHRRCAWPGCTQPVIFCDLHHLLPRQDGGPHAPTNLAPLCRVHHQRVQNHRWDAVKDPATGRIVWTHRDSRLQIASLPDGARPPPWDRLPHLFGLAPPIPEVPPDGPPHDTRSPDELARDEPAVSDHAGCPRDPDPLFRSRPPPWLA